MTAALKASALLPFDVIADSEDREDWLQKRRVADTVGASEVASVLGLSPFLSAYHLACVKTGKMQPENLDDNERVFWGNALESAIVFGYGQRTGRRVVMFGLTLRSRLHPWLTATPDALTTDDEQAAHRSYEIEQCLANIRYARHADSGSLLLDLTEQLHTLMAGWWPLQIKNIGFGSAEHWSDGVPDYYEAQCRTEAILCQTPQCTAAALVAGQQLVWDDVARNDISDRQIVNLTRAFAQECAAGRLPPVDGSESTRRAIQARWPMNDPEQAVQLGASWLDLVDDLEKHKGVVKLAKTRIDEIENQLKAEIADADRAVLPDGSGFSYRSQKRKETVVAASEFRVLRRMKAKGE